MQISAILAYIRILFGNKGHLDQSSTWQVVYSLSSDQVSEGRITASIQLYQPAQMSYNKATTAVLKLLMRSSAKMDGSVRRHLLASETRGPNNLVPNFLAVYAYARY